MKYQKNWNYLQKFINKWTIDEINSMPLAKYVKSGESDTFANSLEDRAGLLGQIGNQRGTRMYGMCQPLPGTYTKHWETEFTIPDNDGYSWKRFLSDDRANVLGKIKKQIVEIINIAKTGNLNDLLLDKYYAFDPIFRLKMAFIYQDFNNIRLLPVYTYDKLSKYLNNTDKAKTIFDLYSTIIEQENIKTFDDAFAFMEKLYLNLCDSTDYKSGHIAKKRSPSKLRKMTDQEYQTIHSDIQKILVNKLKAQNWDVRPEASHRNDASAIDLVAIKGPEIVYYEVKSYDSAIDTIREALGQLLEYWYYKKSSSYPKATKLIIAGHTELDLYGEIFLDHLRTAHKIPIYYEHIIIKTE